jgi:hypothetical protein
MQQKSTKSIQINLLDDLIRALSDWIQVAYWKYREWRENISVSDLWIESLFYLREIKKKISVLAKYIGRRVWRYQSSNQNPYIEEEQAAQWQKEKGQKDKQRSTKHTHKAKDRVTRTPLKTVDELRCSGRVGSSCSTSGTGRVNVVTDSVIILFYLREIKGNISFNHIHALSFFFLFFLIIILFIDKLNW